MKKELILAAILLTAVTSHAFNEITLSGGPYDVVVPILNDEPSSGDRQAGQIFYDIGAGLKVVNPTGGIDTVTTSGASPVTTGAANDRLERAAISSTGTVSSESSDWISGNCTNANPRVCTFVASTFAATPICVAVANDGTGGRVVSISAQSSSSISISSDPSQYGVNIICMGSR